MNYKTVWTSLNAHLNYFNLRASMSDDFEPNVYILFYSTSIFYNRVLWFKRLHATIDLIFMT